MSGYELENFFMGKKVCQTDFASRKPLVGLAHESEKGRTLTW